MVGTVLADDPSHLPEMNELTYHGISSKTGSGLYYCEVRYHSGLWADYYVRTTASYTSSGYLSSSDWEITSYCTGTGVWVSLDEGYNYDGYSSIIGFRYATNGWTAKLVASALIWNSNNVNIYQNGANYDNYVSHN